MRRLKQEGGKTMNRAPAARSLLLFFAATFAASWTCFVAAVSMSAGAAPDAGLKPPVRALVLLGAFVPSFVALALTAWAEGGEGVRALLARLFQWRVSARWYVFALGYMAAIKLAFALVHRLVEGSWPTFGSAPWVLLWAAALLSTVIGGQAGEEIGWRGYALPRLAPRLGLGGASHLLGVIWAVWHLPLFYLPGADSYGQSFPAYLLQVTAFSVAIAWLYARTHGSLLLVMLMHAAINNTKDIIPAIPRPAMNPLVPEASLSTWLTTALLWTLAAWFLVRMRRTDRP
jgi:membrane protease YdiL (CAAX protease family)